MVARRVGCTNLRRASQQCRCSQVDHSAFCSSWILTLYVDCLFIISMYFTIEWVNKWEFIRLAGDDIMAEEAKLNSYVQKCSQDVLALGHLHNSLTLKMRFSLSHHPITLRNVSLECLNHTTTDSIVTTILFICNLTVCKSITQCSAHYTHPRNVS